MGLLKDDLDYHLIRASMVIIYFFFGYQKWCDYEAQGLIPFFTHGPLIFWMVPVFGIKSATYLLGGSEWLLGECRNGPLQNGLNPNFETLPSGTLCSERSCKWESDESEGILGHSVKWRWIASANAITLWRCRKNWAFIDVCCTSGGSN
jgi:hypothetical protein